MCLLLPELVSSSQVRGQDFKSCLQFSPKKKKKKKSKNTKW